MWKQLDIRVNQFEKRDTTIRFKSAIWLKVKKDDDEKEIIINEYESCYFYP